MLAARTVGAARQNKAQSLTVCCACVPPPPLRRAADRTGAPPAHHVTAPLALPASRAMQMDRRR